MKKINCVLVAPYEVRGLRNNTIEECIRYIEALTLVGVDIETTRKFKGKYGKAEGLNPHLSDIVMLQVGDVNKQFVIDTRVVDVTKLMKLLATKIILGHNIKFEYKFFLVHFGIRLHRVYDTMIGEQILHNGYYWMRFSLKDLNHRYLGITVDKSTRLEFLTIGKKPFTKRQIEYGAEDIIYPLLIKEQQIGLLREKGLMNCMFLEMRFLIAAGDIEAKGLHFNTIVWERAYQDALVRFKKLKITLDAHIVKYYPKFTNKQLDLFSSEMSCGIKWTSAKQVVAFFDHLGICPEAESKSTKLMRKTVEAKELQVVLTDDTLTDENRWLIKTYLKLAGSSQAISTFGIKFFKYVNPITGRLHSNYKQIMKTGRISSTSPNLQNIPALPIYRMAFDAPKGYKIVNADYSGQESVIFANKTLDPNLLEFYESGSSDMHSFVASKIYSVPMEDILAAKERKSEVGYNELTDYEHTLLEYRQNAKAAGFAIQYGGSGFTIAKNLGIPQKQGDFVYDAYFKAFPGLRDYFDKCKAEAVKNGYIVIDKHTNRKYFFPYTQQMTDSYNIGDFKAYNKLKGKLERASLNYPIQGCAGSMTKLAVIYIREYLVKHNAFDRFQITNIVHDEINCEAREDCVDECKEVMEECMKRAADLWCTTVQMNAEGVIGDYWAH